MHKLHIDINCDMGEGLNNEERLMPFVNSCNIACGFHAGDAPTMARTVALAAAHKVKVGAHPSFPDRENFGRKPMHLPTEELTALISYQVGGLMAIAAQQGVTLHHVKPHGALYNMAASHEQVASAVLAALQQFEGVLYAPYGSVIAQMAKDKGIQVWHEAFADRAYNDQLELVSRKEPHAVLHDTEAIYTQVASIVRQGQVQTISGITKPLKARTMCVHGDNPNAENILRELTSQLRSAGITLQ